MKLLYLLFFAIAIPFTSYTQCSEQNKTRVLLVGDSWAFFMGVDQTINNVFRNWGHSDVKYYTNPIIAENGAQTDDFQKPEKRNEIIAQLEANPDIDFIHLSIGGNDVLGRWKVSFSQAQIDSLKAGVEERLMDVIDFLKSTKPGIRILWSGYVYTNFEEVISGSFLGTNHPFYGTWSRMQFPTNEQINQIQIQFSDDIEEYANTDPQFDFINAPGLMQYTFGQNSPLGVEPFGTYPSFAAPLPYGYPEYPSPQNSMRNYGLTLDCFHLSPKGYEDMISYQTQKYYHKLLMNDLYILAEGGAYSGSVSSQGAVSEELLMGNLAGEDYSTVITFNTKEKFDTTLAGARIFLRRESLSGSNPISGNLEVKIKSGHFGTDLSLEPIDLGDAPDAEGNPCLFGSSSSNRHWIRLDLPAQILPFINGNETTQFIISAPGVSDALVKFTDASDPEFAPVLDLIYGENPVSVNEVKAVVKPNLSVFPNPTNGILYFKSIEDIKNIEVIDLLGKSVAQPVVSNQSIDVSFLKAGTYFIRAKTTNGVYTQKIIKQ
jgi:lysophospholipase L1-like esterase